MSLFARSKFSALDSLNYGRGKRMKIAIFFCFQLSNLSDSGGYKCMIGSFRKSDLKKSRGPSEIFFLSFFLFRFGITRFYLNELGSFRYIIKCKQTWYVNTRIIWLSMHLVALMFCMKVFLVQLRQFHVIKTRFLAHE